MHNVVSLLIIFYRQWREGMKRKSRYSYGRMEVTSTQSSIKPYKTRLPLQNSGKGTWFLMMTKQIGILPRNFANAMKDVFIGSVELTRNGYDMSAAIAETRSMNTNFFWIAASYEKIMLEGDSIDLACLDALSQVLYSTGYSLRDRNVLVMGARGNLGRLCIGHLANILESSKKQLWGCDLKLAWPKPKRGSIPKWAEWSACDKPLTDVAGETLAYGDLTDDERNGFDVIISWTGGPRKRMVNGAEVSYQTISGQDVADWLTIKKKSNLYLVSGSTKTVEFSDVLVWLEEILNEPAKKRAINGIMLDDLIAGPIPDQLSIAAVAQMWPDTIHPQRSNVISAPSLLLCSSKMAYRSPKTCTW